MMGSGGNGAGSATAEWVIAFRHYIQSLHQIRAARYNLNLDVMGRMMHYTLKR